MFQRRQVATIALNILVSIGTLTAGVKTPEPLFLPLSIDKAMEMAVKQNRIVFIDFSTAWCGACKRLDEVTWCDRKVIAQLKKGTIPLKMDGDKDRLIRDKYHVNAYPTLLFLDSDGSVLGRFVGYQIPAQFIEILQGVMATKPPRLETRSH